MVHKNNIVNLTWFKTKEHYNGDLHQPSFVFNFDFWINIKFNNVDCIKLFDFNSLMSIIINYYLYNLADIIVSAIEKYIEII